MFLEPYLHIQEYRPATFSKPLALMQEWSCSIPAFDATFPAGKHLRIFAGQSDPNDATHFMIPFEIDSRPGVLDVWEIGGAQSEVNPRLQGLRLKIRDAKP
jgi:hypothetical protein